MVIFYGFFTKILQEIKRKAFLVYKAFNNKKTASEDAVFLLDVIFKLLYDIFHNFRQFPGFS